MRKSRFSDEQMVAILREAEQTSVAETAKKRKVSEQTIYLWRKHFAGMAPADVKRLKALETENAKLKRLLAERDLELDVTREVNRKKMVSPQARRDQVRFVCERGVSQRRACGLLSVPRSTLSYRLRQPEKDAPALAAMRRLSSQYPRYGYRRIRIFLRREGLDMGINRARRLWRHAGLGLPRKRPRRRVGESTAPADTGRSKPVVGLRLRVRRLR